VLWPPVRCSSSDSCAPLPPRPAARPLVLLIGQTFHAAGVDGVDRDLAPREQVGGLAELIGEVDGGGEGKLHVAVGQHVEGEGSGEPDEVFAPRDAAEIARESVERFQRDADAQGQLVGAALGDELVVVGLDERGLAGSGVGDGILYCHLFVGFGDLPGEDCGGLECAFLAVHGGAQHLGIAGEALQQVQLRGEPEDGHARSGGRAFEVLDDLLADEGLIGEGGIERIEQQNVQRAAAGRDGEVGESAGRKRRQRRGRVGGFRRVLVDVAQGLGLAVLQKSEVGRLEVVDGAALLVGDDDIDGDQARGNLESGDGGLVGGGLCGRDGQKKRSGEEREEAARHAGILVTRRWNRLERLCWFCGRFRKLVWGVGFFKGGQFSPAASRA
jgi:hypothetical protein